MLFADYVSSEGIIRNFFLNPHNLEFLLGTISAIVIKKNRGNAAQLLLGLCMIIFYVAYLNNQEGNYIVLNNLAMKIYLGLSFMLIVTGLCSIDKHIKYPRFLILIGAASYSIYLIHDPAISILNRIARQGYSYGYWDNPNIIFIFVAASSLIIGLAYYMTWEKTMLKILKRKFIYKQSGEKGGLQ